MQLIIEQLLKAARILAILLRSCAGTLQRND